jgi:hypothetical protein
MNNAVAKIPDERESFGPCMLACRPDEREFVLHVIAGKSNAEAAKLAGWGADSSANTLARIGHRLAHRDRIIAAIGEEVKKLTRSRATLKAAHTIDQILDNPYHKDAARVALSVLERSDPTIQKTQIDLNVKIDNQQVTLDYLKHLKEIGAPREVLLREFGSGGLDRYERLLAGPAPIDVEYAEVTDPDADILGD